MPTSRSAFVAGLKARTTSELPPSIPELDDGLLIDDERLSSSTSTILVLARPSQPGQDAFVGNQTGGRVTFFLRTDDFSRDYNATRSRGVEFVRAPIAAPYGTVAVFKDLYGNLWDLVGPANNREAPSV